MAKNAQIGGQWMPILGEHLGGTAIHPAGGTSYATVPTGCQAVYMRADGNAYYSVNGTAAGTNSHGYIPQGQSEPIFNIDNLSTISFSAAAGVTVYVQYYSNMV